MKKWLAIGLVLGMFTACDDGDLVYEDLTFTESQVARCNANSSSILYKLSGDQVFILNIPNLETELPTEPTPENQPKFLPIGTSNRVIYRHYTGTATQANICDVIQPATPVVDDEWTALSGTIAITTTAITTNNSQSGFAGGEKISKLQHQISLINVVFNTGSGQQSYDIYPFGIYAQDYAGPVIPSPNDELEYCDGKIFNRNSTSVFVAELSSELLDPNVLGTKTAPIDPINNKVSFRIHPSGANLDQIDLTQNGGCEALFSTPTTIWNGMNGSETELTGIIEVTTTNQVSGYVSHAIHLKNVRLAKNNLSFLLATDYLLGTVIMPN